MALIKPFKGVRPKKELAEQVAALPYDVMNTEEAIQMAAGNDVSFLHISRPEIDLPQGTDSHSDEVYAKGRENLETFMARGVLLQDESERYYVYRQKMGGITQTGLVVCAGVDDYQSGAIKKHELTRADKEEDRVRHIDALNANDEPVFYTYRNDPDITQAMENVASAAPLYHFTTDDGVSHALWPVAERALIDTFTRRFQTIPTLYVADGHHRSAAASRVRDLRMSANPKHNGGEEYNFFLTVIFPDNEMTIMPYNRVVKDLNGRSVAEFIARVAERFDVTPVPCALSPGKRHQFGMYLAGTWYQLTAREGSFAKGDAVSAMDVSILQDNLLNPVLGVRNPRTDQRIHFVGGIRGVEELERVVNSGEYQVAFSLFPTSVGELMSLADEDKIMPPKSTWFEPKLRSGLFLHLLD